MGKESKKSGETVSRSCEGEGDMEILTGEIKLCVLWWFPSPRVGGATASISQIRRLRSAYQLSRCRCVASGSAEAFGTQRHIEGGNFQTHFRGVYVADSPVRIAEARTAGNVRGDAERRWRGERNAEGMRSK